MPTVIASVAEDECLDELPGEARAHEIAATNHLEGVAVLPRNLHARNVQTLCNKIRNYFDWEAGPKAYAFMR